MPAPEKSTPMRSFASSNRQVPYPLQNLTTFHSREFARDLWLGLVVSAGYYVGTLIGFALTPSARPISTFWPPNAILLAALSLAPRKKWWIFIVFSFLAHMAAQVGAGIPVATAVGWFVGNATESLVGAFAITQFEDPDNLFNHVRGLLVFLAFGVVGAPLLTSFVDAANVVVTGWGNGYWPLWTSRLLSNMLAELTLASTIVLVAKSPRWGRETSPRTILETTATLAGVALVSLYGFAWRSGTPGHVRTISFLLLPLLLFAALRLGMAALTSSLLIICLISAWADAHGHGSFTLPFVSGTVLSLQIFLCMVSLPFMFLAVVWSQQRWTERVLRESRERLINTQELERRRIARELHDGLGQSLALLESEIAQLRDESERPVKPRLDKIVDEVSEISRQTREISHGLHPAYLEHLGLVGALKKLCREFSQDKVLSVYLAEANLPFELPSEVALAFYRITQEALRNVEKYSRADRVEIRFIVEAGKITMQISDNGIGFPIERRSLAGIGIANMRERLELVGGTLSIASQPMKGTRISASVRLPNAA